MEYKKEKDIIYLRIDKGEKIVETIKELCKKEDIRGGAFQGIGACGKAALSTYIPEQNDFTEHRLSGMLEMISLMGNISADRNGQPFIHSHALFSCLDQTGTVKVIAGHLKEAEVSYTAELVTIPSSTIERRFDENAGIDVWKLS